MKKEYNLNGFHGAKVPLNDERGMVEQCGRSMVEMLGVLAIIGVLSVGGIAGYRQAMAQKEANDFVNALMADFINIKGALQHHSVEWLDNNVINFKTTIPDYFIDKYGNENMKFEYMPVTGGSYCTTPWIFNTSKTLCQELKDMNLDVFKNTLGQNFINYNVFNCEEDSPSVMIDMCVYQ